MTSKPLFVRCCHCRWCQRETGSAFALNALIESDRVQLLQGEAEVVHTPSASGKGQEIFRCPKCRVALWSNYGGSGDVIRFVRVGTLDEPDRCPPDIHLYGVEAALGGTAGRSGGGAAVLQGGGALAEGKPGAARCAASAAAPVTITSLRECYVGLSRRFLT